MLKIKGKCEYVNECPLYDKDSLVCNEEAGFYGSRYAGCYNQIINSKKGRRSNKRKTYSLVNKTGKVLRYGGKLQYFRTKTLAKIMKLKLQNELKIELEIKKIGGK